MLDIQRELLALSVLQNLNPELGYHLINQRWRKEIYLDKQGFCFIWLLNEALKMYKKRIVGSFWGITKTEIEIIQKASAP